MTQTNTLQYQQLADKYAPTAAEVADTLANLQVPPDDHHNKVANPSTHVPLPKRGQQSGCNQHQIALLIRDGRRAAQQLSAASRTTDGRDAIDGSVGGGRGGSGNDASSKETSSGTAITTMSIIMEQDFTVEGKKGVLDCPLYVTKRRQQLLRQQQQLEQENQQLHITGGGSSARGGLDIDHDGADTADIVAAAPPPGDGTHSVNGGGTANGDGADGTGSYPAEDPICAALAEENASQQGGATSSGGAAPRCPIRFLDQHSPEEVAHYVETHKHELPRSHAICLKRYNKNEEQIRKMDAKYGNLVNMISGLGQFHQSMLASAEPGTAGAEGGVPSGGGGGVVLGVGDHEEEEVDRATLHKDSHERVKKWANGVSASTGSEDADGEDNGNSGGSHDNGDDDGEGGAEPRGRRRSLESSGSGGDNTEPKRESHFDRPLKEVRLGESPSRPWGIAVPISSMPLDAAAQPPLSPPAAPVRMPSPLRVPRPTMTSRPPPVSPSKAKARPAGKCPFSGLGIAMPPGHAPVDAEPEPEAEAEEHEEEAVQTPAETTPRVSDGPDKTVQTDRPFSPMKPQPTPTQAEAQSPPLQQTFSQPAFVNFPPQAAGAAGTVGADGKTPVPQMVFTGPVFIGFQMEQAAQFLQIYHNPQGQGR